MSWFDFDFGGDSNTGPTTGKQYGSLGSGFYDMPAWTPASASSGSSSGSSGWDLGSLFDTLKSGYKSFNDAGGSTLVKAGLGAYDAYNKNKLAKQLMPQINELNNAYAPGSPEAEQMRKQMEARDAASGRRSQYGTRAVELAGELNKQRSQIRTSPGYLNLYGAQGGQSQGAYKGLADLFGQVSKTNFADGGLVGASGDESDIQWKGTDSGFGAKDLSFLSSQDWQSSLPRDSGVQFSKSFSFDDGPKQMKAPKAPTDDWVGDPTDAQIQDMNPYATDAAGVASGLTGQGDATLADFWQGGSDSFDPEALGQQGIDKWTSGYNDVLNNYNSVLQQNYAPVASGAATAAQKARYQTAADAYNNYLATAPSSLKNVPSPISNASGLFSNRFNTPLSAIGGGWTPNLGNYSTGGGGFGGGSGIGNLSFGGFSGSGAGAGGGFNPNEHSFAYSRAEGGIIPGHDLNGTDDVKANLTRGEFVLPTHVVDAIGADKLQTLVDMFDHKKRR